METGADEPGGWFVGRGHITGRKFCGRGVIDHRPGEGDGRLLGEPLPFSTSERGGDRHQSPPQSGNPGDRPDLSVPAPTCTYAGQRLVRDGLQWLCRNAIFSPLAL